MKITNFSFTLCQATTKDGYGDNYYVNIDENGVVNVSHPYKSIEYKEQVALLAVIQSGIAKYALLVAECDTHNQLLKLEEYAPSVSSEETTSESAAPQSCALGDEEVSTGADGDIDKPQPKVVTDEDIFG
jgi:hypothetical protein